MMLKPTPKDLQAVRDDLRKRPDMWDRDIVPYFTMVEGRAALVTRREGKTEWYAIAVERAPGDITSTLGGLFWNSRTMWDENRAERDQQRAREEEAKFDPLAEIDAMQAELTGLQSPR